MAVREFDYAGAKNVMTQVESQSEQIQEILNRCDGIINETVGQPRKWTGQRATNFKNDWTRVTENFSKFGELIREYSTTMENAYKQHQTFDQ